MSSKVVTASRKTPLEAAAPVVVSVRHHLIFDIFIYFFRLGPVRVRVQYPVVA
jgi:hypothetical protein